MDSHQHTMMGQLVHVDGDKAHAFSYGNWLLVREAAEGGPTWLGMGWYDDELVRTDQGWRIQRRVSENGQACWYWRSDANGVADWGPTSRPVPQWTRPGATPVETLDRHGGH